MPYKSRAWAAKELRVKTLFLLIIEEYKGRGVNSHFLEPAAIVTNFTGRSTKLQRGKCIHSTD